MILQRSCTEVANGNTNQLQGQEPFSLETFRDVPAYVLLGDPGAGKTTAFEAECKALGEKACPLTADEFLTYSEGDLPSEWQGKTVFIDGLDEVRASAQGASEFRQIRKLLRTLGKPRFRLSCREADWLGANDQERLESVSPDSKVRVLRLNPLAIPDVEKILSTRSDVPDPRAFITTAQEKGVDGLLFNPLSLRMLAEAVAGGQNWPETRGQTFELACNRMILEHNENHQIAMASNTPHRTEHLLEAAGRLCSIQLLAGKAGYTRNGQSDSNYPDLEACGYECADRLRLALASKLFKGLSNNRFTPVHRHVAEFLAARYLSGIIGKGSGRIPARRVLALFTGENGTVVQNMRGLSAWLATLSEASRRDLIRRDPIGVGLYGDISGFSLEDKQELLRQLEREGSWIDPWVDPRDDFQVDSFVDRAAAFAGLATPELEPALTEILEDGRRDQDHEVFTDFVIRVLEHGEAMPGLSEVLYKIIRDETRWPRVNTSALRAFLRMRSFSDYHDITTKLRRLLDGIRIGNVSDPNGRLLSILLVELYPDEVTTSEIWSYFCRQIDPEPVQKLWWIWEIVDKSSGGQVAELLDHLHQRFSEVRSALELHHMGHLAVKLLAQGLKGHGDGLATAHLYDWLRVGEIGYAGSGGEDTHTIRHWLEQRPDVQKELILEGLDRCPDSDDFRLHAHGVHKHLFHANLPSDFGCWCLEQAMARIRTRPRVAEHLFETAFQWRGGNGPSLPRLREQARKNRKLKACLDRLLAFQIRAEEQDLRHQEYERTFNEERKQEEERWLAHVRSSEAALNENRAAVGLLFQLAQLYLKADSTNTAPEAIAKALRGDQCLTQAVLQGFRGMVDREDLPGYEEILDIRAEDRMPVAALPFLVGLAEIERTTPDSAAHLDDDRIREAIAFYCAYGTPLTDDQARWYQRLLVERPHLVAEVLVQLAAASFRKGREHVPKLWELAHDGAHAQVARYASLPLLRAFPTRCKLEQLRLLDQLLWAAIKYADGESLREVIEKKRSRASLNDAQRVHWLAAGFALEPETYQKELSNFVHGREKRVRQLAEFFCQNLVPSSWFEDLGIAGLERFIRLVGRYIGPELMDEQGWVTTDMEASRLLYNLIRRYLAGSLEWEATRALESLIEDRTLYRWHNILSLARDTQRFHRGDAEFRHPAIEKVRQALNGGKPANAGDLAALVADRLQELADAVRKGDTNAWRQYWNVDRYDRPEDPRPENSCRDILLTALQQRLQSQGIDARSEVQHANDKRSDICISCDGFQVPVEIKRNDHRDLWSALRNQLIAQYTNHPGADGYGIYLVFWFGKEYTQAPPSGKRPTTATELQERLKKEAKLSESEERKISVHVIDVSKP